MICVVLVELLSLYFFNGHHGNNLRGERYLTTILNCLCETIDEVKAKQSGLLIIV